ncbi:arylamine N-acetyltransferase [Bacteroidota bacterium]
MSKDFIRYLNILGIKKVKPSLSELKKIIQAQLKIIPFENISKLYYLKTSGFKGIPTLNEFLDGIEKYNFGGTCYANNFHLYQLLRYLGYDVLLCGANMKQKDVHIVNIVKIDGTEFIVDVGYAAPFLEPIPRNLLNDYKITFGTSEYVFSPIDSANHSKLSFYRESELEHGYQINPKPRHIHEFAQVVEESYRPDATFMNSILIVRYESDYSQLIHNKTFIETSGSNTKKRSLNTLKELEATIEEVFRIPSNISNLALKDLAFTKSAWS